MQPIRTALIVCALLVLLLSACSTQQRPPLPTELAAMTDNLQLEDWRLSGKLGIRGEQISQSAYLNWQQCGDNFDIRISGPLGQGAARLQGDKEHVLLDQGKQSHQASSPEQLLQQQLGWSLPVSQLKYWIRGIPSPDSSYRSKPEQSGFEQAGWLVSYSRLQQLEGRTLPDRATATHPRLKITLLLKSWDLSPDCSAAP